MKKRIWSLLLAAMLLLSVCGGAMATDTGSDVSESATITLTETDSTVNAYHVLTMTLSNTGAPVNGSYAWVGGLQDWVNALADKESKFAPYTNANNLQDSLPYHDEFYTALAAYLKTTSTQNTAAHEAETNDYVLSGLGLGQHLIVVNGGTRVYKPAILTVLPVYNTGNSTWGIETTVPDMKVTDVDITKHINEPDNKSDKTFKYDTANINQQVTFDISADIPGYPMNALDPYFAVSDTMSTGLTYAGSLLVWGVKGTVETELTLGTEYHYATDLEPSADKNTFKIEFVYGNISGYERVHITYNATLNENAVPGTDDGEVNTATLEYSNDPFVQGSHTPDSDRVNVYTYGIIVVKQDPNEKGEDGENLRLPGAEFNLQKADGTVIYFTQPAQGEEDAHVYKPVATPEEGGIKLVSNSKGEIKIDGLDVGTYSLVETQAPGGYNMMDGPQKITITKANDKIHITENPTTAYASITVDNYKGPTLPSTGGMGTTLFTIIGIALMAAVVVILVVMSRKKSKQAE